MRKRWGLGALVDAFIHHIDVGSFIHHIDVGSFIHHIDFGSFAVIGVSAFRGTNAGALSHPAGSISSTVTDGSACAVHGCVVLPAY